MSSFADLTFPTPKSITGGCLCGGVRYQVDFPPDHDFKKSSGSCQCTQCRRQTGALFFTSHKIAPASTCFRYLSTGPHSSDPPKTLKEYIASPIGARGFCTACGSFLYWRPTRPQSESDTEKDGSSDSENDYICLAVGTIDPEYLFGEEGLSTEKEGKDGGGTDNDKKRGYGLALVNGGGEHSWCVNEIWGVTDRMEILGCDGRGERKRED